MNNRISEQEPEQSQLTKSVKRRLPQDNPPKDNPPPNIPFIVFIFGGLGIGAIFSSLSIPPFVAAFSFGAVASLLVHHSLGGLKHEDGSIKIGSFGKLGGTLASLVLTTIIFNHELVKQKTRISLLMNPEENNLVILERNAGHPIPISITAKDGLTEDEKKIETPKAAIEQIKQICIGGGGFCQEPSQEAVFSINADLKKKFALVCQNQNKFDGYPLMISSEAGGKAIRVTAYAEKQCTSSQSKNQPLLVEISSKDAKDAKILDKNRGIVNIPPLKIEKPRCIFIPSVCAEEDNQV